MQTRKLTEVPRSEFAKETNFIVEIDEELKRVPSSDIRKLVTDERTRATEAEKKLTDDLATENQRAAGAEKTLTDNLAAETTRAKAAEKVNSDGLAAEVSRAEAREQALENGLSSETGRAEAAETVISGNLAAETVRAKGREEALEADCEAGIAGEKSRAEGAEKVLTDNLAVEVKRAEGAEKVLTDNLAAEVSRAKSSENRTAQDLIEESERALAAEKTLTDNLTAEVGRARAKESELQGSVQTETGRAEAAEASIRSTINTNKPVWDDKYTRNEVDNKFSAMETAIDWKEAVGTYADLAKTYSKPEDGWTVNVKDTDYTYRWSGTKWVAISANAIPKATQSVDGLLSKGDKISYDEAYNKRHEHGNKSVIDKITQALLDNWSAAYTHISDAVKHITAEERTNWNDANGKKHTHGNKSIIDGITQALVDKWNSALTALPAHTHTKSQITDMPTKVSQFTNDKGYITQADVDTSQNHTHTNKGVLDKITQALLDKWNSALTALPVHMHTKAQITDFPAPYTHPASGAKAGTYRSVTVNTQGHVTAGTNPTTLAGYGITDAATKTAVEELKKAVSDGKKLVAAAITNKGQATAIDAAFQTMADNIARIETSVALSGNAAQGDVLAGKTFYSDNPKVKNAGTMPNLTVASNICHSSSNGTKVIKGDAVYISDNTDGVRRVQIRYNDREGFIFSNTLIGVEQSKMVSDLGIAAYMIRSGYNVLGIQGDAWVVWTGDATADESHVLSGKTYWLNGVKKTGNMPDHSGTPNAIQNTRIANGRFEVAVDAGYHGCYWAGNSYEYMSFAQLRDAIGLTAEKMVQGQSCLGIWGTVPNINIRTYRATVMSSSDTLNFLGYNNRMVYYPYIDVNVGFSNILHAEALYVPNTVYHTYYSRSGNYFLINYADIFCACAHLSGPNMIFGVNNVVRIPVSDISTQYDVIIVGY